MCFGFLNKPTSALFNLIRPIGIRDLISQITLDSSFNPGTLNPSTKRVSYTVEQAGLLRDQNLTPIIQEMGPRDRLVETDYGYVIMDIEVLRDWTLLAGKIKDPDAAKSFLEGVANFAEVYPNGLAKESTEWLRWSALIAHEMPKYSFDQEVRGLINTGRMPEALKLIGQKMKESGKFSFQGKEAFVFPFQYAEIGGAISTKNAPIVLATLARYFVLNNIYVRETNGKYRRLSELFDRDHLILFSRFPEILSVYPIFQGGHFNLLSPEHSKNNRLGVTEVAKAGDYYQVVERVVLSKEVTPDFNYQVKFTSEVRSDEYIENPGLKDVYGTFYISFQIRDRNTGVFRDLNSETDIGYGSMMGGLSVQEARSLQALLDTKIGDFETLTGHKLPRATLKDESIMVHQSEFEINFEGPPLPPHILTAFYIFIGLDH